MKVAFLGLGVMGYPMAGHLANSGHQVTVFNRTQSKADKWCQQYQGTSAPTPKQSVQDAELVFLCVGNDDDVRAICYGDDGIFAGMKAGAVLADHTTASADLAEELGNYAKQNGFGFLDAPISGGQSGAENGILTIMIGGEAEDFAKAESVMASYGKTMNLMGKHGAGQLTKMVNQIFIVGVVEALAEGLNFAMQEGLDCEKLIATLKGGAAQSWQLENRASTMVKDQFDFGFATDWMIKDLGYCLERSKKNGAPLALVEQIYGYYQDLTAQNHGKLDSSVLIKRLR